MPDLGISTLDDVLTDVRRITDVTHAAAAGRHRHRLGRRVQHRAHGPLDDQGRRRRRAHRGPGRRQALRPPSRQGGRVEGRDGRPRQGGRRCAHRPDFVIMARTDALAVEGLDAAIERAVAYVEAGADMIFPEAMTELAMYRQLRGRGQGADPRQHHRVRPHAAVHRSTNSRSADVDIVALLLLGLSRDERGGAQRLPDDPPRRHAEGRRADRCRRAPSSTTTSAITPTSRSSTSCSRKTRMSRDHLQ